MKAAIMQPYFFPAISYFQLMGCVDLWVVFDDIQFIDKGWINRNRILHPNEDSSWQFITLPLVNKKQFSKINEIEISTTQRWRDQILGKLTVYKKAPHYKDTVDFVKEVFSGEETNLSLFVQKALVKTRNRLGIDTKVVRQPPVARDKILHSGSWALEISKVVGASEYVNPCGGFRIFREAEFEQNNIRLRFLKKKEFKYKQYRKSFEDNLSIIDVMMWNSPDKITGFLKKEYSLCSQADLQAMSGDMDDTLTVSKESE